MAAIRKKPTNPFLYKVLQTYGYIQKNGSPNIKHAAVDLGIPYTGLIGAANVDGGHQVIEFHMTAAKAFNIPFELWCKGLLDKLDESEEAELTRLLRRNRDIKIAS